MSVLDIVLSIAIVVEFMTICLLSGSLGSAKGRVDTLKIQLSMSRNRPPPPVSQEQLKDLVRQANALGWDIGGSVKLDSQVKKLLALATDPHANDNEARSAAMQVCKRLARK